MIVSVHVTWEEFATLPTLPMYYSSSQAKDAMLQWFSDFLPSKDVKVLREMNVIPQVVPNHYLPIERLSINKEGI